MLGPMFPTPQAACGGRAAGGPAAAALPLPSNDSAGFSITFRATSSSAVGYPLTEKYINKI